MDKFTVDLDKVLDEFEQNEDSSNQIGASNNHVEPKSSCASDTRISPIEKEKSSISYVPRYDFPFEPTEKLDLAEADFAATLQEKSQTSKPIGEYAGTSETELGTEEEATHTTQLLQNVEKLVNNDSRNFSSENETVDKEGAIGDKCDVKFNDIVISKSINLDTSERLQKVNNDIWYQKNSLHNEDLNALELTQNNVEGEVGTDVPNDSFSTPEDSLEKSLNEERSLNTPEVEDVKSEETPLTNDDVACDSFTTPISFTSIVVSNNDLETYLKETETELGCEAVEENTDVPTKVSTEDSSSGEEYFSPVGEVKTPLATVEEAIVVPQSGDTEDFGLSCDRDDAGIHRSKANKAKDKMLMEATDEDGAMSKEIVSDDKVPEARLLKDQRNLEIKSQINAMNKLCDEIVRQDEEEIESSLDECASRRQRPTSLRLAGIEVNNLAPLDFPTPANTNENYLDLDDTNDGIDMKNAGSPTCCTPDWHGGEDFQLGLRAPYWIPDSEASSCMQCNIKFTVLKRRHHCRACGQVLCSQCCGAKAKLPFMDNREARVCNQCYQELKKVDTSPADSLSPPLQSLSRPNPNNPNEYCSTIPPLQQASPRAPLPTVMVPVGVLKREGFKSKGAGEPKQVIFSDGIRPGGDLTELDEMDNPRPPYRRPGRIQKRIEKRLDSSLTQNSPVHTACLPNLPTHLTNYIPEDELRLPPVLLYNENGVESIDINPDPQTICEKLYDPNQPPIKFAINKNLFVNVKVVGLNCCVGSLCWCFTTSGMCNVAQEEIMIVIECLPEENHVPKDIFHHLSSVYEDASQGIVISHLSCSIFNHTFLSSRDHGGFLYIKPTTQCLKHLPTPETSYFVGILLQKWEIPWAKVFPLRLMLRLGTEFNSYPCPVVSLRFRKPVFFEVGHTIMNLLADFRNFQYTLPNIRGMKIHIRDKETRIKFPRNRYDEVMRALSNSNDHVLALGSNFSIEAESHLVCIQNEDGNYQTHASNPQKLVGASFVVFSGALKSSSGLTAKLSIVEDGVMVQIPSDKMAELRQSLRDMHDLTIECGPVDADVKEEVVIAQWVDDDKEFNLGVKSPIDNMAMDGIQSIRIHGGTDYAGERWILRWTEMFLIQTDELINSRRSEPVNISRIAEKLAQAFCMALTVHLDALKLAKMTKLGLRATVDSENVGYEVGSLCEKLPSACMNDLDSSLIPVIHRAVSTNQEGPVTLELIFHILEQ